MSIFIAYPDGRIGREARTIFIDGFGSAPDIENRNRRQVMGKYEYMITKARNVPRAVEQGCLFGLTGLDFLKEYGNPDLVIIRDLMPFCKSRVVLFEPSDGYLSPRVVTVYPNIARKYLEDTSPYGDPWELMVLSGETESWVASGMAGRGIDVVESGKTLEETGLIISDTIMRSNAVIIARKDNIDIVNSLYKGILVDPRAPRPKLEGHSFSDGG